MSIAVAPRFADISQFEQCVNGARMTPDGFDANGDLVVDESNDPMAVGAIQGALRDLGYPLLTTFTYDDATTDTVRRFKVDQQLPVPRDCRHTTVSSVPEPVAVSTRCSRPNPRPPRRLSRCRRHRRCKPGSV
ncbi:hypothetical protein H4K36_02765 [Streptomyces sp. DHE7-1]|nr:hypothetical protein [Streptomyces sp. DHE7-1]